MMEGGESKEGGEKFKRKDEGKILNKGRVRCWKEGKVKKWGEGEEKGKILKKGRAGLMNYTLGEGKMKEGGGSKEGVKRRKKEY